MPTAASNAWMLPIMAGVVTGLLSAAVRMLWARLDLAVSKIYAKEIDLAVLKEKIKHLENEKKSQDQ